MFNRPVLVLPVPDGLRGYGGFGPLSTLLVVCLVAFIYIDQRYGEQFPALLDKIEKRIDESSNSNTAELTSQYKVKSDQSDDEKNVTNTMAVQADNSEGKNDYTYFKVITDNTKIRSTPERTESNATGMLDINEQLIYLDYYEMPETFKNSKGIEVEGYWIKVYRLKTGANGWVHQINLEKI
jgi:hypothetical protein